MLSIFPRADELQKVAEKYVLENKDLFFSTWGKIEYVSALYPQSKILRESIAQYILDNMDRLSNGLANHNHLSRFLESNKKMDKEIEKDAIAKEQSKLSNR